MSVGNGRLKAEGCPEKTCTCFDFISKLEHMNNNIIGMLINIRHFPYAVCSVEYGSRITLSACHRLLLYRTANKRLNQNLFKGN